LQKGKTPCKRQLPTAAFMRMLTYCVTAAPGATQALRRGFAGHITLMNKLITKRDYFTQEIYHLLLELPLVKKSRVVMSVNCRLKENHTQGINLTANEL